jgi:hypothetical protein
MMQFEYVQEWRILTDWQLRAVASQAAAAEYILEQRASIDRMVRDHGAAIGEAARRGPRAARSRRHARDAQKHRARVAQQERGTAERTCVGE